MNTELEDLMNLPPLIRDKSPKETRTVVAMSGGVDSSTIAALLYKLGYEVIGVTLQLYDNDDVIPGKKTCCAGQDVYDAKRVAEAFGFPHYVMNYESVFRKEVIDDFADSYMRGETPIPCIRCNKSVKFRDLYYVSKNLNADVLVTGHYVKHKMDYNTGTASMYQAKDISKDQSYFLFSTTQEQLRFLRFPLGDFHKDTTRKLANHLGVHIADKPDSQDICFVGGQKYQDVIRRLRPDADKPGEILDYRTKQFLCKHNGVINYTIGQRKGIGISSPEPLYVIKIDVEKNQILVGLKDDLYSDTIKIREINWVSSQPKNGVMEVEVKIRSSQKSIPATIAIDTDNEATVKLHTIQHTGVAPGQACVIYDAGRVLGGGWIY